MAIYHCSIKTISRGNGQSIVASASYRHACILTDNRTGEMHDYTRKRGVEFSRIILPSGVNISSWMQDREQLWNAVEAAETRKNSRLGREVEVAIPTELSREQREVLVSDFTRQLADRYGVAADVAIHQPHRQGDERNYHAHILVSSRRLTQDGFGEKARELDDQKQGPLEVERIRAEWANVANHALELAELSERIDHRSLRAQGVSRLPTVHLGPSATAMERRGESSERGEKNREAQAFNGQLVSLEHERQARADAETARQEDTILKAIGLYGKTASESWLSLNNARGQLERANAALFHARREQEDHNNELNNIGIFKRNFNIFYQNDYNKRAKYIEKKLNDCIKDCEGRKMYLDKLEESHRILIKREKAAKEKQSHEKQNKEKEISISLERSIENAKSHNEYRMIFHEIAKQDEPNRIESHYDTWAEPYMNAIKSAGTDHQAAFRKCIQLAKRDVTTDKILLQRMERDIYQLVRNFPGTVGQHSDQAREMLNTIRLHDDRQQAFDRVTSAIQRQREQNLGLRMGR